MTPTAPLSWTAPRWALAFLLAGLGMLGPFAIDTYIPAFTGIAASLGATSVEMQQTLSAYLIGFAVMNLFHGAISDSVGRRPVVLVGLASFTLASAGCALSTNIAMLVAFRAMQGLSTGAGMVVSRAVIRDLFAPEDAQRVMSQVTLFFGIAPAIAPLAGGWLFELAGWRSVFWMLVVIGIIIWIANYRYLPETLAPHHAQRFNARNLMRGYRRLGTDPRFALLALASGVPFNGMFLYVMAGPAFLGEILALPPTRFFWCFLIIIAGIMLGAFTSGRLAGRIRPADQMRFGFVVMATISVLNVVANLVFTAHAFWALLPIGIYSFGWALTAPIVQLLVLDLAPERRGMASSLQSSFGSFVNAAVAGVLAPMLMHSPIALAIGSAALMSIGLVAWLCVRSRWPDAAGAARRRVISPG